MMFTAMLSFCNCDEPKEKPYNDDDIFPRTDQLWGMIGTMIATMLCYYFYMKQKFYKKKHQDALRFEEHARKIQEKRYQEQQKRLISQARKESLRKH